MDGNLHEVNVEVEYILELRIFVNHNQKSL